MHFKIHIFLISFLVIQIKLFSLCFIIDAVCCVVLNEFSVLSALFTLKAHSPDIAKEWSDQITSAQVRSETDSETYIMTLTEEKAQLQEELEFIKGNPTNGNTVPLYYYTV